MARIIFSKQAGPVIPTPTWSGWTDFTDPVYWTVTEGSWDGVKWVSEFTGTYHDWMVVPLGTGPRGAWWENAKPTQFRITFTGNTYIECYIRDTQDSLIFNDVGYQNLEEKTISYDFSPGGPWDMASLQLKGFPNPLEITKIEFYAP